ncbi:MAG: hypothetical protein AAGN66_07780 [Acidobacteriota bacterium]
MTSILNLRNLLLSCAALIALAPIATAEMPATVPNGEPAETRVEQPADETVEAGAPEISFDELTQPEWMRSVVTNCWPNQGGICAGTLPVSQCRADCDARYNYCLGQCAASTCGFFRQFCRDECCYGYP